MVKFNKWLVVLLINLCLAQCEHVETSKGADATVAKDDKPAHVIVPSNAQQVVEEKHDDSQNKPAQPAASSTTQRIVVISEKTLAEIQSGEKSKGAENKSTSVIASSNAHNEADNKSAVTSSTTQVVAGEKPNGEGNKPDLIISPSTTQHAADVQLAEKHNGTEKKETNQQEKDTKNTSKSNNWNQNVLERMDIDLESSVNTGFYLLMTISAGALLFVSWKVYKLRLSRAERKYGVRGDRRTQELAPLPLSMEDIDSDEDDQTIFDRHQIRIF